MKNKCIILGLVLIGTFAKSLGQNLVSITPMQQMYIIKANEMMLLTDSKGISVKKTDSCSKDVVYINPNWIDSMETVKGKDAIDKYSDRGLNGVVVINLSADGFIKMRDFDRNKFVKQEKR